MFENLGWHAGYVLWAACFGFLYTTGKLFEGWRPDHYLFQCSGCVAAWASGFVDLLTMAGGRTFPQTLLLMLIDMPVAYTLGVLIRASAHKLWPEEFE